MAIWTKIITLFRGAAHEAGTAVVDANAMRILDQEVRDAQNALLRARDDLAKIMAQRKIASDRKGQVGSGDRSEKIRTYNFQQARVSDHRIGLTIHRLHEVLDGDLDEIVAGLIAHHQAQKLKGPDNGSDPAPAAR